MTNPDPKLHILGNILCKWTELIRKSTDKMRRRQMLADHLRNILKEFVFNKG